MSLLSSLETAADIVTEKDSVGGAFVLDSGLYEHTVNLAYITKSAGGAMALNITLKDAQDRELRQQLWMTSGTAKGCKTYYEKDGVKSYLPGFNMANSLSLLTVGKSINELDTEEKVINLWNSEAKAEVPTKVQMVMDLVGQNIISGVLKQTVNKNVKNDAGDYVPTADTRDVNEIDKFFRAKDKLTTAEILGKVAEPTFYNTWNAKWTGQVQDKTVKGAAGVAGAPQSAGSTKPKESLFA